MKLSGTIQVQTLNVTPPYLTAWHKILINFKQHVHINYNNYNTYIVRVVLQHFYSKKQLLMFFALVQWSKYKSFATDYNLFYFTMLFLDEKKPNLISATASSEQSALSIFISHIIFLIMGQIEQRVQCTIAPLEYSCPKLEESGKGREVRCNCN